MLPISGKMQRLYEECSKAQATLLELRSAFSKLTPDSNLTMEIGCFLTSRRNNFKFTILQDDVHEMANLLRKVCTGEISPAEARTKVDLALHEINIIYNGIEKMKADARK